ncbi:uncharacterized protein [Oscarella lobularis]|uniref:uncharacterized protein n=1 Tax=Oscarella lobularis TaxID=121494 RepID=UPI00331344EA
MVDQRWRERVFNNLSLLIEAFNPMSVIDKAFAKTLISPEEYHQLRDQSKTLEKKSRILFDLLPRKGDTAFDEFVTVLEETDRQEHVLRLISKPQKKEKTTELAGNVTIKELEELSYIKATCARTQMNNNAFRYNKTRICPFKWEQIKPNIPYVDYFWPSGCVAEIKSILHACSGDRMLQLKEGKWQGKEEHLGIHIESVFECEGKGYVIQGGGRT